ncbi:hypothetical protein E8L99_00820 [Phreatobacter aquaticus]|uniref:Uncharacterized protein n=1 Tax=Phreatobacter aquaticus TaxID=2570229 RepID=A0A4D7QGD0_9HYPH|nr:hypothetical protein [Phreatobacter aquaticus]QCK84437.1 hypothetical protein E8L99_00820 [Phreatobacter aquaticus]
MHFLAFETFLRADTALQHEYCVAPWEIGNFPKPMASVIQGFDYFDELNQTLFTIQAYLPPDAGTEQVPAHATPPLWRFP